ncbi:ABC transporter substrate-binding protein [Candidatus Magnetomorum sp. HK-1]|nr:ABC transporter substrate-binding protein [Candidatus Magnetomorum sp. HK-1]
MDKLLYSRLKNQKDNPVRLGRIQYMNVAPVYYDLDIKNYLNIEIIVAPPSALNQMLALEQLDISSVSSAAYARNHHKWQLLPDLSISSCGPVMSVKIVSRYLLENLNKKKIILTSESETAVDLLKLLLAPKNINPKFQQKSISSPQCIKKEDSAALLIGDIALKYPWEKIFPHVYDLGELWTEKTGLPFIFGVWAVRKKFASEYPEKVQELIKKINHSKEKGLANIKDISRMASQKLDINIDICHEYYQRLNFDLTERHIKGMTYFFSGLYEKGMIDTPVEITTTNG